MTNMDTPQVSSPPARAPAPGELSPEGWHRWDSVEGTWVDRRVYFNRRVAFYQARGYSVMAMDDRMAKLFKNHPSAVPLWAHILLTFITFGLWLPIWLIIAVVESTGHKDDFVTLEV